MISKSKNTWKFVSGVIIALFLLASVLSFVFMDRVSINYNLANYLGEGTQTKVALDIIDEQFGMTGNIQVMAKNVSPDEADDIKDELEQIENVLNVNFDKYDSTYYKDKNALFIVIIDGDDYSENAKQVSADIKTALSGRDGIEYGGTTVEKKALQDSITSEMVYILAISLLLVVAILLITSESWLEPFVLLAASGVAVLLNRGSNLIFGEISYITNSIAAILQLALSIDYSIVLLHTYRREKQNTENIKDAMKKAVISVIKPVSASALTTIAGLLALLFMSFRIGFDIGIVLMKGIVISAITSLTLLPALVLLLDGLLKKTAKRAFVPKGKGFCTVAFKAGKVIVPIALVLVIVCGALQTGNSYIFSDTKSGNPEINDVFGSNNTVVAVYKNSDDSYDKEQAFAESLKNYKTKDGKSVLTNYTAYSNTVRESYDAEKALQKLELSENDTEMLYTMYNLYRSPSDIELTFSEFVDFANGLVDTDEDTKEFIDDRTDKTLKTLKLISEVMNSDLTASELHEKLTTGVMEGTDVDLFSVKQLYGLYFYDSVGDKDVDFMTMLNFLIAQSENENTKNMFDAETVTKLKELSAGITKFKSEMEAQMTKEEFRQWMYKGGNVQLNDVQLAAVYNGYFASTGTAPGDTIPFLPLMKFVCSSGFVADEGMQRIVATYDGLYRIINEKYGYEKFLPVLSNIAGSLSGSTVNVAVTDQSIQQIYILYFYSTKAMPESKINGRKFVDFALSVDKTNDVVHNGLTADNRNKLNDMRTVDEFMRDDKKLNYEAAYIKLNDLKESIKSDMASTSLDEDKISGVYIKFAVNNGNALTAPMEARELLDFVSGNMDTNTLLKQKMSDENRKKVADATEDINKANDLFLGDSYSRMLLSLDLPNESRDTTEFVDFLIGEVKRVFGDDSYITGEIVSTYDLEKTFSHDNTFITVFTLISIFVIVMVIFRSLSLPVILVAVIQGAIFIAMSTQLIGSGIFFMSYIVSTCILMGATIDYGILMSSNYVSYRNDHDRSHSLLLSVSAAMPTVFTSGLILTVCGFVIHFISSQNSISTVGLLLGIGTVCSVVMITVVLPSLLYMLDKFVLKLSLGDRKSVV